MKETLEGGEEGREGLLSNNFLSKLDRKLSSFSANVTVALEVIVGLDQSKHHPTGNNKLNVFKHREGMDFNTTTYTFYQNSTGSNRLFFHH